MAEETIQKVPFMDLRRAHEPLVKEVLREIEALVDHSAFISSQRLEEFEKAFSDYSGSRETVACSNGTQALVVALRALGIGPGDEVITQVNTFIATAEAICEVGATPVFVDVSWDTALMEVEAVERKLTEKTKAIIAVHLYGQPVDLESFESLCNSKGIALIQDAAQAHGAHWSGKKLGEFSGLQTYSFYPGKNLGAWGDAGAITGSDESLIQKVRAIRDHGRQVGEKYLHHQIGTNARMDVIQSIVLKHKLIELETKNHARRRLAQDFRQHLAGVGDISFTECEEEATPVYHLFVVKTSLRDELRAHLAEAEVQSGIHYPVPLHQQPAFEYLNLSQGTFPIAETLAKSSLSLPFFPEMSSSEFQRVVDAIKRFYE